MAVLLLHAPPLDRVVPHGYLAVDLFFMMSGFVVAHAYGSRLARGWSVAAFMRVRIVRLWPLYLLGTAIGAAVFATAVDDVAMGAALGLMVTAGIFMIPLPLGAETQIFNLNRPAWSLFFEMVANLIYALVGPRLGMRSLATASAVGALAVVVTFTTEGTGSLGHHGPTMIGGAARILFAFPLGVLLHRLHKAGRLRLTVPTPVIVSAFLATLMLPDFGELNGVVDAAVVVLVFPMVIASAITAHVSGVFARPFGFLAVLSYPLYILHGPIVMGFAQLAGDAPVVLITAAGTSLAAAWMAARWFDDPARTVLGKLLSPRPRAAAKPEPG